MKTKIAKVKLAPGNRVFFDPLTGINLNQDSKTAFVCDDMELSNIRAALKSNRIQLAEGRLPSAKVSIEPVAVKEKKIIKQPVKKEIIKVKEEITKVKEDVVAVEEVVIKKSSRKKKTKSTDELNTED